MSGGASQSILGEFDLSSKIINKFYIHCRTHYPISRWGFDLYIIFIWKINNIHILYTGLLRVKSLL